VSEGVGLVEAGVLIVSFSEDLFVSALSWSEDVVILSSLRRQESKGIIEGFSIFGLPDNIDLNFY
jgi:hypothetical protein